MPFGPPSRRRLLALVGGIALPGCSGRSSEGPGTTTATNDSTTGSTDAPGNGRGSVPVAEDSYDHPTPPPEQDWQPTADPPSAASVEPETLIENLEVPWDLSFAPGGDLFLTERTGRILRFTGEETTSVLAPDAAIDAEALEPGADEQPWFVQGGEGGTLGVAVHPAYPESPYVYVYYTTDQGERRNRVVRYDVSASDPAATESVIVDGVPADQNIHHGGRIEFGPDDNLWILTGDANQGDRTGDPAFLGGKVLRVTPDGAAPSSNPLVGTDGADPRVFTTGHRNPQGISWLPGGLPLVTEHGPAGRDEISVLTPGGNYGWNEARGGPDAENYDSYGAHPDYRPPVVSTTGTWAPSGATFYTGEAVPAWRDRLLVGRLAAQGVAVVTVVPADGDTTVPGTGDDAVRFDASWLDDQFHAVAHGLLTEDLGRVRHVEQGPDGDLYAITSNRDGRATGRFPTDRDDRLVRLHTG